jgi:GST-like protein
MSRSATKGFSMTPQLELYGDRTGNCLRAAIALEEAELPYVARHVDLNARAHLGEAFLSLNPLGKVPVLVDRTGTAPLVLTQSNAIMTYAAQLAPGKLTPVSDERAKARCDERFFYFVTDVISPSMDAFLLHAYGMGAAAAPLSQRAAAMMQAAETFLDDDRFMSGAQFGLADIAAYTIARALQNHIDWRAAPRLSIWMAQMAERPGIRRGLAAFDQPDTP